MGAPFEIGFPWKYYQTDLLGSTHINGTAGLEDLLP